MSITTKIVGVTYQNGDGSTRQGIIASLHQGDHLRMVNCASPQHPESIGVFTSDGKQCGFLSQFEAGRVRFAAPNDFERFPISVLKVTGGNGQNYGCNIEIDGISYKTEPSETGKLVQRVYVDFQSPHVIDVPPEEDAENDAQTDSKSMQFAKRMGAFGEKMQNAGNKMQQTGSAMQKAGKQYTVGCLTTFICLVVIGIVILLVSSALK